MHRRGLPSRHHRPETGTGGTIPCPRSRRRRDPAAPAAPASIPSPLYRMTVEEYETMVASGAFKGRNRFQLISGLLVARMTQNPPHTIADILCGDELDRDRAPRLARAPGQADPAPRAGHHEQARSLRRARGSARDYLGRDPGPGDIALIVEVADSSLAADRELGTKVYGPAGIEVYWIINLVDRQVEVYTGPGPQGYGPPAILAEGQSVPLVIDGREVGRIAVADMLPPRRRPRGRRPRAMEPDRGGCIARRVRSDRPVADRCVRPPEDGTPTGTRSPSCWTPAFRRNSGSSDRPRLGPSGRPRRTGPTRRFPVGPDPSRASPRTRPGSRPIRLAGPGSPGGSASRGNGRPSHLCRGR